MTPRSETREPAGDTRKGSPVTGEQVRKQGSGNYLLAVPVLLALLVAGLVALAASPALRHQLAQSFTRQDKGYLELFFVNEQSARDCPVDEERRVKLDVAVRSHFDDTRTLAWTVTVNPTRGTVQAQRGRLDVRPDKTATFTARVPVVSTDAAALGPFTVTVALPGHSERLLLHC